MAVDEQVDAGDLLQQVDGAVARGLIVDAQMAQADDVVALVGLQGLHLLLGAVEHLLGGQEGHALDLGGVGLGGGLGGVQAEHADLHAVLGGKGHVVLEGHLAIVEHVGGHDGILGALRQLLQVLVAVVELMVAQRGHVIAHQVHQLHGGGALADADGGVALDVVARVHQQDVSALLLVALLQSRHLGVPGNAAVHVVGVEDDDSTLQLRLSGAGLVPRGGLLRLSGFALRRLGALYRLGLCGLGARGGGRRKRGHRHAEHHRQRQQERKNLAFCFHSFTFPFFLFSPARFFTTRLAVCI